jgi:phosphomannomutase/phosphoglucomutase
MMMTEKKTLAPAQAQLLRQLGALVAVLLAAWFGWSAWEQLRDSNRRQSVEQARDAAVQAVQGVLAAEQKQFAAQLQSAPVQAALAANDLRLAGETLTQGWGSSSDGEVLSTDLDPAYAGLPKTGYGRLAAMEQALADHKPVAWIITDGLGKQRLALAAPVMRGKETIGVASASLPLDKLGTSVEGANVPEETYLALRQGASSLVERGDKALANGAETMAAKVPGSDLRVAAAVPDVAGGPFGLDWLACAIATVLLALGAVVAWFYPLFARGRGGAAADADEASVQTLGPRPASPSIAASSARTTCAAWLARRSMPASPTCWASRLAR